VQLQEPAQLRFRAGPNILLAQLAHPAIIVKYFTRNQKKPYKGRYFFHRVKA
jgi:hypothetical protein